MESAQTLLAHEWLAPIGGSENVFEILRQTFPDARAVCAWNDAPDRFGPEIEETWLARTPFRHSKALALPFLSRAWNSVNLDGVNRVVVSSHAFAHHLAARASRAGISSFAYVHSPARYVWAPEFDSRGQRRIARFGRDYFRKLDRNRVSKSVRFAANSEFVRDRIAQAWGVESTVIHPPTDIERLQSIADWRTRVTDPREVQALGHLPTEFVLGASRLVEYKRVECAITAAGALGLPCVIAGQGPDETRLRKIAESAPIPVTFFGHASSEALYSLFQEASLFVFMAIEDFGIMPVEAMSLGTPVIVNEVGGSRESVAKVGLGKASPINAIGDAAREVVATGSPRVRPSIAELGVQAFKANIAHWVARAEDVHSD